MVRNKSVIFMRKKYLFNTTNFLFILLITIIFFSFQFCSKKKDILPDKVGDLILVKTITGEEAKNFINQLHFQPVTENENWIGYYENMSGQAIVYVTVYKRNEDAISDFDRMTKKISPENSVFVYPEFFNYNDNKIYKCFGMGMTHYVFALNQNLYWISVDTHLAKNFFEGFYHSIN